MTPFDAAPFAVRLGAGLGAGLATWVAAYGLGSLCFNALRVPSALRGRGVLAIAAGYAVLGTLVGAAGLVHGVGPFVALGTIGVALVEIFEQRRALAAAPQLLRDWLSRFGSSSGIEKAATGAAALAVLFGVVAAALPAVFWDPLAYHLPIVARALADRYFAFDPGMTQTGFPLLAEAAALPAFAIAGTGGAAYATLGAGIAFAVACGVWAEQIAPRSGRLAVALVTCSALWLWLAPSFYVDIPFAMFAIAGIALPAIARAQGGVTSGAAAAAGMLAGAAAAVKYPGIIVVVLVAGIVFFLAPAGARVRSKAAYACGALAVGLGWYVRSWLLTGDPVYPFLTALHPGPWHEFARLYVTMTAHWCGGGTSFVDLLTLPWHLLVQPQSFCGDPGYALDLGAVFVLAALAIVRRVALPLIAGLVLTPFWFESSQQWRFLIPAVGLFAIVAAVGATDAVGRLRTLAHGALVALCVVGVVVDALPNPAHDASNPLAPAFAYIAGAQTGDDYLSSRLETYDAARWLRAHAPNAKVALLNDVRGYYFGPRTVWCNAFYQPVCVLDWSAPARRRYQVLRALGVDYVVIDTFGRFVQRQPSDLADPTLKAESRMHVLEPAYDAHDTAVMRLTSP